MQIKLKKTDADLFLGIDIIDLMHTGFTPLFFCLLLKTIDLLRIINFTYQ